MRAALEERQNMERLASRVRTLAESWRDLRGGQVSYLLLAGTDEPSSERMTITWVDASPGSEQPLHSHDDSEQAYVIVQGKGLVTVGPEGQEVGAGSLVLIPPGERHSIRALGDERLVYVSATVPPFPLDRDRWSTPPESR
jgi:mannose-6-phosphate isomerase-like protein (cupin superfamily)